MSVPLRGPKPTEQESADVEALADELFAKVQESQGFFYVSDGEGLGMRRDQFFDRIRGRLEWGRLAVKQMRAFLAKHDEIAPREPQTKSAGSLAPQENDAAGRAIKESGEKCNE